MTNFFSTAEADLMKMLSSVFLFECSAGPYQHLSWWRGVSEQQAAARHPAADAGGDTQHQDPGQAVHEEACQGRLGWRPRTSEAGRNTTYWYCTQ